MISVKPISELSSDAWNEFVTQHVSATPYHRYDWVAAVQDGYGHSALAVVSTDENETINGLLPLVKLKPPVGKEALCSLPFCDVGGVLANSDEIATQIISQAKNEFASLAPESIELRTRGKELDLEQLAEEKNNGMKVSMIAELPESSEVLLKSYKPKLRSQIKKAEKNGLTSQLKTDGSLLDPFYDVIAKNMRDLGSPVHGKAFYKAIVEHYKTNASMAVVYLDDVPTAAGLVLKNGHKASIPWASSLREYNNLAPNMLLYWTLLADCADTGITEFDFGRSTLNEGTFRFKKQWGATPYALTWSTFAEPVESEPTASVRGGKAREIVENVWKKLPLPMTIAIGPAIRKYISL